VDPRLRVPYYTAFLEGFRQLGLDVRFRRLDCPGGGGMGFQFGSCRVWVDADDMTGFDADAYDWSDVFGKVNCLPSEVMHRSKLRLLGPSFGLRIWPLPEGGPWRVAPPGTGPRSVSGNNSNGDSGLLAHLVGARLCIP
jgi:hypothetical protein